MGKRLQDKVGAVVETSNSNVFYGQEVNRAARTKTIGIDLQNGISTRGLKLEVATAGGGGVVQTTQG